MVIYAYMEEGMDYCVVVFMNLKLGLAVFIHHEGKRRNKLK